MSNSRAAEPADKARSRRRESLLVVAAFVVFAFLLTWQLGGRELWLDEQLTVGHTESIEAVSDPFHPPGYYFLLWSWAEVFGRSDLALRAFSIPWAILALLMVWLIGRLVLPRPAAMLAVWLCALSPFALLYLRMARYFSITLAVAMVAAYFMLLARQYGKRAHYVGLALSSAAVLYVHNVPVMLLPFAYLWVLPAALKRPGERYWWALAAALPLAAYLPQAAHLLQGASQASAHNVGAAISLRSVALKLAFAVYSVLIGETTDFWRLYVIVPVGLAGSVLWIIGAHAVWKSRQWSRWPILLAWPLSVGLVCVVLSTVFAHEPWPRISSLALFAAPFCYMLVARGATILPRVPAVALAAVFLLGQAYGVTNYLSRRQFLNPGYNVRWAEVNRIVQDNGAPGDLAVAVLDRSPMRYWNGPVAFREDTLAGGHLSEELLSAINATLSGGHGIWVIARDRGSNLARNATRHLVMGLDETTAEHEVHRVQLRTPDEQRWRSRIQGYPAEDAYLKIHRFRTLRSQAEGVASSGSTARAAP